MVFQHIEKLKQEYTDKYVTIAHMVPELKRFEGRTGIVRTVNMSGRALVEFLGTTDISWYDIDIDYLKIVDRPPETVSEKAPGKKVAANDATPEKPSAKTPNKSVSGASTADILAMARGKKPAETNPKKQSTADILAAARGKKKPAEEEQTDQAISTAEKLALLRGEKKAASTSDTTEKKKPSTADILAMARGNKSAETKKEAPSPQGEQELSTAEKLALLRDEKQTKPAQSKAPTGENPPNKPSTADILAMARAQKNKDGGKPTGSNPDSQSDSSES
ncbi:hypothetical protein C5Y96_12360 [Blastopirellula marina]|uniref:Uncharacterized protein n=1 Tax=Blastopirellula marina TaxID=124 RepID=A0A2S8FGC8_9BACT|nr:MULTISPECIES: hypothetical protein [Pirellulaceae]PQO31140.1 hypothetical protein C5Y96_12360 [Blastopirellula marina]RCS51534.1 hypothetical protein DTL36_12370 [Bremerella cremea]